MTDTTRLSWVDPDTADLVTLDVSEHALDAIRRGKAVAWRGSDPVRTTAEDAMLDEILNGYPGLQAL